MSRALILAAILLALVALAKLLRLWPVRVEYVPARPDAWTAEWDDAVQWTS